jgi:ubiquinone/menaquinone biosynthesis C-methylase UbiE
MNAAEHFICSSSVWRYLTKRKLLPWILSDIELGDHLLEIGAGYGAATAHLRKRVLRVTSLEYDHASTRKLKPRHDGHSGGAVHGDATRLPFASQTFSSALAILVLHHLKSRQLQNRVFEEAFRVLRPGGVFVAFEITDSWIHRVGHIRSTFTPVSPGSTFGRLSAVGFSPIALDLRSGAFRFSATRPGSEKNAAQCVEAAPQPELV